MFMHFSSYAFTHSCNLIHALCERKVCLLWKCLHIDVGEDDVVQDIDSVNPVEISDAVLELKQRDIVHRHPEGLVRAQDLHLEQSRDTTEAFPPSRERESA